MVKIFLSGCNGRMGQVIISCVAAKDDCEIVGGADIFNEQKNEFPVYSDIKEFDGECDVIIDFSNPAALGGLLEFCLDKKVPAVLATTGYSEEQKQQISEASKTVPIFYTANMSIGVNLIAELCKRAATVLEDDFDIEIVEAHHKSKTRRSVRNGEYACRRGYGRLQQQKRVGIRPSRAPQETRKG